MTGPSKRAAAALALVAAHDGNADRLSALLRVHGGDPVRAAHSLGDRVDVDRAARTLAERRGRVYVTGDDGDPIPPDLPDRPQILVAEGVRVDALAAPKVAIVGTRAATPHGRADAHAIAGVLARAGVTVVSGLAIGIDAAAHEGALDAGGLTVGVVATGLDVVYPRRHRVLFERVRAHGVLVSECPYGTAPLPWRFPIRNRIIAGMSRAVVVVEATLTGGARITADLALGYGVDVLAVPGSRRNPAAAGCNALIADGAHPLLDPSDVLVALGMGTADRSWTDPVRAPLTGDGIRIHEVLGGEPATTDQIGSRTGLTGARIAVALVAMEREGWVTRSRGMIWPL